MSDTGGDARAQRRERARRARRAATAAPEPPLNSADEVHLPVPAPEQEEVEAGDDRVGVAGEAQLKPKRRGRVKLATIQEEPDDVRTHERNYLLRVVLSRLIILGAIMAFGWALWEAAQIGIKIYLRNL